MSIAIWRSISTAPLPGDARNREGRVRRQAVADHLRFRDRQFVEGRLQAAVVEQRDLHRGVGRQDLPPDPLHGFASPLRVVRNSV